MLLLFKHKRNSRILAIEKMISHYLAVIKELSDIELARGLDMAAEIKHVSLEFEDRHTDYWNAFTKPVLVSEKTAERIQDHWLDKINTMFEREFSPVQLYATGMSIWSHSLLAAAYPELRQQGLALWNELQRGFKYCEQFDPQVDVPEII